MKDYLHNGYLPVFDEPPDETIDALKVLAPGENRHSGPGENRQFWPGENRQSLFTI